MEGKKEKEWYWEKIQETLRKIGLKKTIIQWKKVVAETEYLDWSLLGPSLLFPNQYFNCVVPEIHWDKNTLLVSNADNLTSVDNKTLDDGSRKNATVVASNNSYGQEAALEADEPNSNVPSPTAKFAVGQEALQFIYTFYLNLLTGVLRSQFTHGFNIILLFVCTYPDVRAHSRLHGLIIN
uniref:Uncharacterized protein n=1 Tax=Glossina palpalis gambiensis TaxID=67801 RepID=A0A1B0BEU9_9MUSC